MCFIIEKYNLKVKQNLSEFLFITNSKKSSMSIKKQLNEKLANQQKHNLKIQKEVKNYYKSFQTCSQLQIIEGLINNTDANKQELIKQIKKDSYNLFKEQKETNFENLREAKFIQNRKRNETEELMWNLLILEQKWIAKENQIKDYVEKLQKKIKQKEFLIQKEELKNRKLSDKIRLLQQQKINVNQKLNKIQQSLILLLKRKDKLQSSQFDVLNQKRNHKLNISKQISQKYVQIQPQQRNFKIMDLHNESYIIQNMHQENLKLLNQRYINNFNSYSQNLQNKIEVSIIKMLQDFFPNKKKQFSHQRSFQNNYESNFPKREREIRKTTSTDDSCIESTFNQLLGRQEKEEDIRNQQFTKNRSKVNCEGTSKKNIFSPFLRKQKQKDEVQINQSLKRREIYKSSKTITFNRQEQLKDQNEGEELRYFSTGQIRANDNMKLKSESQNIKQRSEQMEKNKKKQNTLNSNVSSATQKIQRKDGKKNLEKDEQDYYLSSSIISSSEIDCSQIINKRGYDYIDQQALFKNQQKFQERKTSKGSGNQTYEGQFNKVISQKCDKNIKNVQIEKQKNKQKVKKNIEDSNEEIKKQPNTKNVVVLNNKNNRDQVTNQPKSYLNLEIQKSFHLMLQSNQKNQNQMFPNNNSQKTFSNEFNYQKLLNQGNQKISFNQKQNKNKLNTSLIYHQISFDRSINKKQLKNINQHNFPIHQFTTTSSKPLFYNPKRKLVQQPDFCEIQDTKQPIFKHHHSSKNNQKIQSTFSDKTDKFQIVKTRMQQQTIKKNSLSCLENVENKKQEIERQHKMHTIPMIYQLSKQNNPETNCNSFQATNSGQNFFIPKAFLNKQSLNYFDHNEEEKFINTNDGIVEKQCSINHEKIMFENEILKSYNKTLEKRAKQMSKTQKLMQKFKVQNNLVLNKINKINSKKSIF